MEYKKNVHLGRNIPILPKTQLRLPPCFVKASLMEYKKKRPFRTFFLYSIGRSGEIRTLDPLHPIQVRYQTAPRSDNVEGNIIRPFQKSKRNSFII